jgi:hypothetical protein
VGLTVSGHVPVAVKVEEAADAGIRSIEHPANYEVLGEFVRNLQPRPARGYSISRRRRMQTPTLAFSKRCLTYLRGSRHGTPSTPTIPLLELTRRNIEVSHVPRRV